MFEHKKNCQRPVDKNERTWVRIDCINIQNVKSSKSRNGINDNEKLTSKIKLK